MIMWVGSFDRHAIEQAKHLKVIVRTGVGYDGIDLQAATERGIPVTVTTSSNSRSVAEHIVALMFALTKNLVESVVKIRKGNFTVRDVVPDFELFVKTIGIIGYGNIGREVRQICFGIGMKVMAYDFFPIRPEDASLATCVDTLEELLRDADVVSIHLSLNAQTKDMISKRELSIMKPGEVLLNCARGGIVNEPALLSVVEGSVFPAQAWMYLKRKRCEIPSAPLITPNNMYTTHSCTDRRSNRCHE